MAQVSPARKAAFQILLAVENGQAHSDDLLRAKSVSALAPADRNLATTLVLGVLRWQMRLDQQLKVFLKKPDARLDPEVQIALRLGAFQLLHLDRIPARAAIDESVEITKQAGHRFAAGMVNAVLRKLAQQEKATTSPEMETHPAWLVDRWRNNFGEAAACTICRHGQAQPSLSVRLVASSAEAELLRSGVQLDSGEFLVAARTVLSGDVTATAAFQEGRVRLQDEGSQLVAELAGQGNRILDCCAAPGGKTLILAERNPQAHLVACETSAPRFAALRERLAPLGDRVECLQVDVTAAPDLPACDVALADVPCSGTGTLGRNPEIRHRLRLEDLPRQASLQGRILAAAVHAVRPGGRVVYSTCSVEPEENEQVVSAALAAEKNLSVSSIAPRLQQMLAANILTADGARKLQSCLTAEGYLRLFPGAFGTDGFFVAVLEKLA